MHRLKAPGALLLLVLTAACAGLGETEPPEVRLADIRLLRSGLLEQEFLVDLRIGNPNDFDLPLDGLTFMLEINDEPFARGYTNQSVTIPRLGEATVPVTASATLLDMVRQVLALAERTDLSYRLEGKVFVEGLARRRIPYERSGRLRLAPAASQGPEQRLVPL